MKSWKWKVGAGVFATAAVSGSFGFGFARWRIDKQLRDAEVEHHKIAIQQPEIQLQKLMPAKFGVPENSKIVTSPGGHYLLAYDYQRRNPLWVIERITLSNLKAAGSSSWMEESDSDVDDEVSPAGNRPPFKTDPSIPKQFQVKPQEYTRSGFDRGHLAAAGNYKAIGPDFEHSFLMSNISPQVGIGFNRHYWSNLEQFIRGIVNRYGEAFVMTGPLFMPRCTTGKDGQEKCFVKYDLIGSPPRVAVPTHFFKVICVPKRPLTTIDAVTHYVLPSEPEFLMVGFILPNSPIPAGTKLSMFIRPISEIEFHAGFKIFPVLSSSSNSTIIDLCSEHSCHLGQISSPNRSKKKSKTSNSN